MRGAACMSRPCFFLGARVSRPAAVLEAPGPNPEFHLTMALLANNEAAAQEAGRARYWSAVLLLFLLLRLAGRRADGGPGGRLSKRINEIY